MCIRDRYRAVSTLHGLALVVSLTTQKERCKQYNMKAQLLYNERIQYNGAAVAHIVV